MLINFSFSNYKSFKGEQDFSMQKDTSIDSEKDAFLYSDKEAGLSCVAAIYGANAAGKSNFLQAFVDLWRLIIQGSRGNSINRFVATENEPTTFDITYVGANGKKYNYSLDISSEGVQFERLAIYKSSQPTNIFEWTPGEGKPSFGSDFLSKEEKTATAYNATTKLTTLFHQLSDIQNEEVQHAYKFFKESMLMHGDTDFGKHGDGVKLAATMQKMPSIQKLINVLLPAADLGIQGVELVEENSKANTRQQEILANATIDYVKASGKKIAEEDIERLRKSFSEKVLEAVFQHKIGDKLVNFGMEQESDGTIAASSIFMDLLPVLSQGAVYFVDELDRSLHPTIVAQIVEIFNHKETNPNGAQIIFTTHDTSLLDPRIYGENLLDRDEIWFVEKNLAGESTLYPLTSIKYTTTKATNTYRKYVEGRYGAIPRVSLATVLETYWKDQNAKTSN